MYVLDEDAADERETARPYRAALIKRYMRILTGPGVESGNRLDVMLALLVYQPSSVFWPVFHNTWRDCDGTWHLRHRLIADLWRHAARRPGVNYLTRQDRAWFGALPDPVPVFRGCSRQRIMGVSWTADRAVAKDFAKGHRGISVSNPVIASALAPKGIIFGAYTGRNESELVLGPEALGEVGVNEPESLVGWRDRKMVGNSSYTARTP